MKQWFKRLKLNSGFSLVEAIVSVAIIGIAIIPISMIFTQSIGRTVDTRKQLEANGIAQYYLENLKNRDLDDLVGLLTTSGLTLDETDDQTAVGLKNVPKGYKVDLSFETEVDQIDFKLPTAIPPAPVNAIVMVDRYYDVDSSTEKNVSFVDGTGNVLYDYPNIAPTTMTRTIQVIGDRSTNRVTIKYDDGVAIRDDRFYFDLLPGDSGSIRFIMGSSPANTAYTTQIRVKSDLTSELKLFIYEDATETVGATTFVESGVVSISRNLYEASADDHRIIEIQVAVRDALTNKIISTITSTKINE